MIPLLQLFCFWRLKSETSICLRDMKSSDAFNVFINLNLQGNKIHPLWGTAQLFVHPRFMHGAATRCNVYWGSVTFCTVCFTFIECVSLFLNLKNVRELVLQLWIRCLCLFCGSSQEGHGGGWFWILGKNGYLSLICIYVWLNNFIYSSYLVIKLKNSTGHTHYLGGENYVFWGGREGYQTLLNTDMGRELGHLVFLSNMSLLLSYFVCYLSFLRYYVLLTRFYYPDVLFWFYFYDLTETICCLFAGKIPRSCCCLQEENWIQWYVFLLPIVMDLLLWLSDARKIPTVIGVE